MNTKDLIVQLVKTSFKLRYNNSFLGFIWVFIKPFVNFLVNYLVWTTLFPNKEEYFAIRLMLGIMIWSFFQEAILFGMNGLLDKAGIILKVNFPRYTAIIASTLMAAVNFVINIFLFFIIFGIYNLTTTGALMSSSPIVSSVVGILGLLLSMVTIYMLTLGASYFFSIIVVKVRDMINIMEIFFSIAYWFTPVLVTAKLIEKSNPDSVNSLYYKILVNNPIGWIIDFARNTIIFSNYDGLYHVLGLLLVGIIITFIGSYYFERKVKAVAEYF
jgi:ABC-2 type transport system permease protein